MQYNTPYHWYNASDFEKNIWPSNCPVSHAFPNVQHLKITLEAYVGVDKEEFFKYFGNPSLPPSLKTLEFIGLHRFLPVCWLQQFSVRAPNVTIANFGMLDIDNFREACKTIWTHLVNLQELKFNVGMLTDEFELDGVMDAAFTGFSKETCKRLRKEQIDQDQIQCQSQDPGMENTDTVIRAEDWKDERKSPSILDLKSLKSLRVDFNDDENGIEMRNDNSSFPVYLSSVAALYAFKMFDKLKVTIGVVLFRRKYNYVPEFVRALENIRPYVTMDEIKRFMT